MLMSRMVKSYTGKTRVYKVFSFVIKTLFAHNVIKLNSTYFKHFESEVKLQQ